MLIVELDIEFSAECQLSSLTFAQSQFENFVGCGARIDCSAQGLLSLSTSAPANKISQFITPASIEGSD